MGVNVRVKQLEKVYADIPFRMVVFMKLYLCARVRSND